MSKIWTIIKLIIIFIAGAGSWHFGSPVIDGVWNSIFEEVTE